MTPLEEIIRAEIQALGPMRFDRFMELALYHPGLGYYAKTEGRAIGRQGDFYTSVSVGPLFGRLLARQFYEMWHLLDRPDPFWVIEQGAHDGRLARDILDWCRAETPQFARALRYGIVSGPAIDGTTAFPDLDDLAAKSPVGVFFSNELVDAFPVRVVASRDGEPRECLVEIASDSLAWTDRPVDDPALLAAIKQRNPTPLDNHVLSFNLRASSWITAVAHAFQRGYIVTIDYGSPPVQYFTSDAGNNPPRGYARHRQVDNVLANPGEQDITAHVDFSFLVDAGQKAGFEFLGFVDQQHFLTGIAHDELSGTPGPKTGIAENPRAFQTLVHPEHLGAKFHALIQARNAPGKLCGLHFARASDL